MNMTEHSLERRQMHVHMFTYTEQSETRFVGIYQQFALLLCARNIPRETSVRRQLRIFCLPSHQRRMVEAFVLSLVVRPFFFRIRL